MSFMLGLAQSGFPADGNVLGMVESYAAAAQEAGVDFAAVLYGWGFRKKADAEQYDCREYINTARELGYKLPLIE